MIRKANVRVCVSDRHPKRKRESENVFMWMKDRVFQYIKCHLQKISPFIIFLLFSSIKCLVLIIAVFHLKYLKSPNCFLNAMVVSNIGLLNFLKLFLEKLF
jgi:hypothetical protein